MSSLLYYFQVDILCLVVCLRIGSIVPIILVPTLSIIRENKLQSSFQYYFLKQNNKLFEIQIVFILNLSIRFNSIIAKYYSYSLILYLQDYLYLISYSISYQYLYRDSLDIKLYNNLYTRVSSFLCQLYLQFGLISLLIKFVNIFQYSILFVNILI